jgi:RNase adaptor protein for sRNA GlmZ degradation
MRNLYQYTRRRCKECKKYIYLKQPLYKERLLIDCNLWKTKTNNKETRDILYSDIDKSTVICRLRKSRKMHPTTKYNKTRKCK